MPLVFDAVLLSKSVTVKHFKQGRIFFFFTLLVLYVGEMMVA